MADGFSFTTRVTFTRFPQVKAHMVMAAEAAVGKAALDMQAQMQVRAPVDTGFLKNSIQARKVGPAHWRLTVGADYGVYLEYGTRFMAAQPFFFPAVAEVAPSFLQAMRRITA